MGDAYSFGVIRKSEIVSGKLAKRIPKYSTWEEDPVHRLIEANCFAWELDRAYYLPTVLDYKNHKPEDIDPEYSKDCCKRVFEEEQIRPISIKQLDYGINLLTDLDDMIKTMPFDPAPVEESYFLAGIVEDIIYNQLKKEKDFVPYGYMEPCGPEYEMNEHSKHSYYGRNKNDVEIVKEVAKVFGWKYYHYRFPWQENPNGAKDIIDVLAKVRKAYSGLKKPDEYTLFIHWY